jgi:hypothetical protein
MQALCGKPKIPKALCKTPEQRDRDNMASLWDFVIQRNIIFTFTQLHPHKAAQALAAWFERQMETGWEPKEEDFATYARA